MRLTLIAAAAAVAMLASGCETEADTVRYNQDRAAEQFEVNRRITFINGITDSILLVAEGRCSYTPEEAQVVVQCKTGEREYIKHSMVRSDNVTVVVEQIGPNDVDPYYHRLVLRPETVIPDFDLNTSFTDPEDEG